MGWIYPGEAVVVFHGEERKTVTNQVATMSKEWLFRRADILSREDMHKIEEAFKTRADIQ